ncbi:DsbA family protein [Pedobacter immunditicola]|uniref:DsbA family protein n=1 Tax=Pedobacter immunditicola TaxID=3133440 RepID=UPI00309F7ADF
MKPSDVASHCEEAGDYYEMPIDGDVWFEDPFDSSYPPSIAVKAAELQGKEKGVSFMRRVREMLFLEKKNITKWEHLQQAAREIGLDTFQFKADYEKEFAVLTENSLESAEQILHGLLDEGKVRQFKSKNGVLWIGKP